MSVRVANGSIIASTWFDEKYQARQRISDEGLFYRSCSKEKNVNIETVFKLYYYLF